MSQCFDILVVVVVLPVELQKVDLVGTHALTTLGDVCTDHRRCNGDLVKHAVLCGTEDGIRLG